MRTRSKRPTTALATAKSKAKKLTLEAQRQERTHARKLERASCRSPSITPPPSPQATLGTFGGPRQDTMRSSFNADYTIGLAVYPLKQEERKQLAHYIIACKARGNAFAADLMRRQLEEIRAEERAVWSKQEKQDRRIAREQLHVLRGQSVQKSGDEFDEELEDTESEEDSDSEFIINAK